MHFFSQCSFISSHFAPKPKKQLVFPRKKVPDKSHYFDCFHCKKAKIYTSQRKDTRHTQSQHKAVGCQLLLKEPWADEYNIACRVSMLCSAAHVVLESQLTITCLALVEGLCPATQKSRNYIQLEKKIMIVFILTNSQLTHRPILSSFFIYDTFI